MLHRPDGERLDRIHDNISYDLEQCDQVAEISRVLRPGGVFVASIIISDQKKRQVKSRKQAERHPANDDTSEPLANLVPRLPRYTFQLPVLLWAMHSLWAGTMRGRRQSAAPPVADHGSIQQATAPNAEKGASSPPSQVRPPVTSKALIRVQAGRSSLALVTWSSTAHRYVLATLMLVCCWKLKPCSSLMGAWH